MRAYELVTTLRGYAQTGLNDISSEMRQNYRELVIVLSYLLGPRNQSNRVIPCKDENKMRK